MQSLILLQKEAQEDELYDVDGNMVKGQDWAWGSSN